MEFTAIQWIAVGSTLIVGLVSGFWINQMIIARRRKTAHVKATDILADADEKGRQLVDKYERRAKEEFDRQVGKAEDEAERRSRKAERDISKRRDEVERRQRKLDSRQSGLDRRVQEVSKLENEVDEKSASLDEIRSRLDVDANEIEKSRSELKRRSSEISGLTQEEAKKVLLDLLETDVRQEAAALIRRVEAETKETAEKKARQLITLAIQKCASDQVSETTVSVVQLPSDDLKGRIIGREGRNIRALEAATGCNIIVDDTPEAVVLSCFDPIRREIARQSLEKLIEDGRIHPARIEDVVAKVEKELKESMRQVGEQTVFDLGLADMHPELSRVLGRLKFRTSYGQNVLSHSIEVSNLCSYLAAELGADPITAKRAGLLHDIGKALTQEVEGTHAQIGADLCKKYNETPGVVHAVAAHHNEVEPRTIIAVLVQGADAISSARPGARRETLENYVKRLRDLEEIANSFPGVIKAYAIQAGREIRVMVEPTEINDNEASLLAREVTNRIEKEVQYPGQIKVTVCRETRAVSYAK